MNFYLMRHAEAELFAESDAKRSLTESGRLRLQAKAADLRDALASVDCIVHSPYLRTRQTAEIMADTLGVQVLAESPLWTPEAAPMEAIESLEGYVERTPLVITHMPIVALVEALLIEGGTRYPAGFNCAEIALIEADWPAAGLGVLKRRY
ncbi:phosphohistidine phosphatase SixA [Neptuniibacter halophilus]|uniref:phosphohistidine phosphatase SixA n=1 Tax=Neptuniibacter halophilus TaxID=651666 RepID=UPI00257220C8|nr:phosphohistidine phosphatase SixA [Neptuniibacter halophilus]